ncbi:1913_t:CDS:2 [Ambispora gerdemannii]|uniref:1913_t:CDS:1 n=1 Tax=Ambispora gerdemannii TaxID=144530 RepID=A0A9N9BVR9_9GLOM|nr:1913_t:CDS:2 [Ambispora gerdemannii]
MPLPELPGKRLLIGHALLIGPGFHLRCLEWQKTLGNIFMLRVGKLSIIILNNEKHVGELFQKRGAKYSSRPQSFISWEVVGRKQDYIAAPYHKWFKKMMPLAHGVFNQRKIETYMDLIYECRDELLKILAEDSNEIFPSRHFQYTTLNVILNVVFNSKTKGMTDPLHFQFLDLIERTFALTHVQARIFDALPISRTILKNRWLHKNAIDLRDEWESVLGMLLEKVKINKYEDGKKQEYVSSCFAKDLLAKVDEGVITEMELIHLVLDLVVAGTETSASAMTSLIAIVTNDPEIQARAHDELDRIVGHSRLPTYDDLTSLPYIRAMVKEVLRWAPPIILGPPHVIEEDDDYMGYHIPKNSLLLMNMYALNWNPARFSNPSKFDPERYLDMKESSAALAQGNVENRDHFSFGAGRRLCLGIRLAEVELELFIASIFWAFKIERPPTEPEPIDLTKFDYIGIVQWIKPYNVRFIPRQKESFF